MDTGACAAAWTEMETSEDSLYLRAASSPVALAAASASSAPPVLSAMFGSRLFDQRVLGLVAQALAKMKRVETNVVLVLVAATRSDCFFALRGEILIALSDPPCAQLKSADGETCTS